MFTRSLVNDDCHHKGYFYKLNLTNIVIILLITKAVAMDLISIKAQHKSLKNGTITGRH